MDYTVSNIVAAHRQQLTEEIGQPVSQEQFGEYLVDGMSNIKGFSRQTIHAWESGKSNPDVEFLIKLYCTSYGKDLRRTIFAVECLTAIIPEAFESGLIPLRLPQ